MPETKKSKAGRKKANIDWKLVNDMLKAGCEGTAIALHIGIHKETLYDRVKDRYKTDFSDYAQARAAEGKELIRKKQFDLAMRGNPQMLIWLGKNVLNQRDRSEMAVTTDEAKENFLLMIPDDGRSKQALLPEAEDAIIVPDDEAQATDEPKKDLFE